MARVREEVDEEETRFREAFSIEGAFRHLNLVARVVIMYYTGPMSGSG